MRKRRGLALDVSRKATVVEAVDAMLRGQVGAFGLVCVGMLPDVDAARAALGDGASGEAVAEHAAGEALRQAAGVLAVCERRSISCVVVAGMGIGAAADD